MTKRVVPAFSLGLTSEEKARIKATVGILAWAHRSFPTHLPDADEPRDPLELVGYSAVKRDIVAEPTGCLGFACPKKSDECGTCGLSGDGKDDEEGGEEDRHLARLITLGVLSAFAKGQWKGAYLGQMLRATHYHDALHDLHLSGPRFRGRDRVAAELQSSRRMNF